jgi:hypothetical protein
VKLCKLKSLWQNNNNISSGTTEAVNILAIGKSTSEAYMIAVKALE